MQVRRMAYGALKERAEGIGAEVIYRNDKSEAGVERWMVASRAFERHDPTRRFANLSPMVQEHWLTVTENVLRVLLPDNRWKKDGTINPGHKIQQKAG